MDDVPLITIYEQTNNLVWMEKKLSNYKVHTGPIKTRTLSETVFCLHSRNNCFSRFNIQKFYSSHASVQ